MILKMTIEEAKPKKRIQDFYSLGLMEIYGTDKQEHNPVYLKEDLDNKMVQFARGMSVRIGRSAFNYWLQDHQQLLGWEDPAFRLLATRKKLFAGLQELCFWFSHEFKVEFRVTDLEDKWQLSCNVHEEISKTGIPYPWDFLRGILQEFTHWAGQGRFYLVEGFVTDEGCGFTLSKLPLD